MFFPFISGAFDSKILLTDSRFLSDPERSVFFAIRGVRHDGHQFIDSLYSSGIREFVVEKASLNSKLSSFLEKEDIKAYLVEDSIAALQELACAKRRQFHYPVVGITGSNGKTIVKEWLSDLLSNDFEVIKSPRSYNSQIGVALSVWEMSSKNDLAIIEAGISQVGEMQALEKIVKPTLGIFTNIGTSHSEGFKNTREKIREKLQLFKETQTLIYCRDYAEVEEEIQIFVKEINPSLSLVSWSKDDVKLQGKDGVMVRIASFNQDLFLPFNDPASIENAMHCAYAGLVLQQGNSQFLERFRFLKSVEMRLELKEGKEGNYLIDDTYNNDLGGLKMALNFLSQTHTSRDKVLVLSDMLQSGLSVNEWVAEMATLVKPQKIKVFVGIGEGVFENQRVLKDLGERTHFFKTTEEFLQSGVLETFQKKLVLVKGARIFSFERVVDRLVKRIHGTQLEINLDAITHNLNFYREKVGKETKIMVMVKAFAYGSGSNEVAAWLQYHRVNYLAVAFPDEGISLRQNGISLPIMVMNADPDSYSTLFEHNLEPEIFNRRTLLAYIQAKQRWVKDKETLIHLKIDTGMHRLGFLENEVDVLLEVLKQNSKIKVASVFSHLVGADEAQHNNFSLNQIAVYERVSTKIKDVLGYDIIRHIANTAGIVRFPQARYDMVRLGIGLYGVETSQLEPDALQTVATLKTTISQIKTLPAGETVGYSRKGVLDHEAKIATVAIGYADGYDRRYGNGKAVMNINGTLCPTVGNVCMDMTMIDVTQAQCEEGDAVIVFGHNPTIKHLATESSTIPYEVLTGVSERVKRVFYHQ